jgi:hypothetical protein
MTEQLTAERFLPYLNKVFRVKGGRHALTLSRVETADAGTGEPQTGQQRPFTLIFSAPPGDVLAEGLYAFAVEASAVFELYVMPVHTPSPDRQDYQAVFN